MSACLVAALVLMSTFQIVLSASCPALTSNTASISCFSEGHEADCSEPLSTGSWAEVVCKLGYTTSTDVTYRRINCTLSGQWDRPIFTCHPDCGRRNTNQGQPLVSGGDNARVGEFPWHVGIYDKRNNTHLQICGGSLISTNIVISAAQCFWSEPYSRLSSSVYEVAAGKHKRDWLDAEDDDQVQRRQVEHINIHPRYRGRTTNFQADVALVRLSTPVDISGSVNLVCVDWANLWEEAQLKHGNKGTVPGWGYTEEGSLSSVLKHVELPYVDYETCYNDLSEEERPLLSFDKFCAGYANRSIGVGRGDSGGGLVFLHESSNRYYLRGLASVGFITNRHSYSGFTLVSLHNSWLRSHDV